MSRSLFISLVAPVVLLGVFAFSATSHAQETPAATTVPSTAPSSSATPSTEKKALIQELIRVMGIEKNADATLAAVTTQMGQSLRQVLPQMFADDPDLTPAQRQEAARVAKETFDASYQRMTEILKEHVDFRAVMLDISAQVYDKLFTADEIRDQIAFYKSPTGQKVVSLTPTLLSESMRLANARTAPQIQAAMRQFMQEQRDAITRRVRTPHPAKPAGKKSKK